MTACSKYAAKFRSPGAYPVVMVRVVFGVSAEREVGKGKRT
jgi:hypothetical protein